MGDRGSASAARSGRPRRRRSHVPLTPLAGASVRGHQPWSGSSTLLALVFIGLITAGLPLLRPSDAVRGPTAQSGSTSAPAVLAALASAAPGATLAAATPPPPGVTPSPEPDPGRYSLPGVTLAAKSSSSALAVQIGQQPMPGFSAVSFRLVLTLGSDFASRLDRSIRLFGPDNIRYLADEPAVAPSLLGQPGPTFDGWVTFLLPVAMRGPASIHITIDPGALTELVVPVVIGSGLAQPMGVSTPSSIIGTYAAGTSN